MTRAAGPDVASLYGERLPRMLLMAPEGVPFTCRDEAVP